MSAQTAEIVDIPEPAVHKARTSAPSEALPRAGSLPPDKAWALVRAGRALLVDVRSAEERHFVGHVPGSVHVAWATGLSLTRNARFVPELEARVGGKGRALLLLCRSGKRSALAAEAAIQAGFTAVYSILEGFEGDADDAGQRGHFNGWRFRGLPWVQD